MRITFVLPAPARIPMGGVKVVYAHARGLAARGHEVHVVGPRRVGEGMTARAFSLAVQVRNRWHGVRDVPYYEAEGVHTHEVPIAAGAYVPDADAVIATGVQTTPWVRDLPPTKGTKFYFIQSLETFIDPRAVETWHFPFVRITIAEWIRRRIEEEGLPVAGVVPNAVDPADFFVEQPIGLRPPRVVALYHRHAIKGPDVLVEALTELKLALPEVEATVFAARRPSHRLPPWVSVHVRPPVAALRALFNGAAVFLHASRLEGFPLVPMEAASCGCAVVASDNEGVQEYLEHDVSMRTAPVGDGVSLAEAAVQLLRDPDNRTRLASAAEKAVARYRWSELTARFESLIIQGVEGPR